jgi:WD40 repeat protein
MSADVSRGIAPLVVQFDSGGSTDDGLIISRIWDFGDGQTSSEISPRHTFTGTGEFETTLTLVDDQGGRTRRSIIISVTLAPIARIGVDRTSANSAPAVFNFDASDSVDPDGLLIAYQWDFGDGSGDLSQIVPHTYGRAGTYRVRLTVTDNTGVTNTDEAIIEVGIPRPTIQFRTPPQSVTNIVLSQGSPLWANAIFDIEPNIPRTIRAGLDRDVDQCDANATLFNAETGEQIAQLLGPDEPVTAVAFSPDGSSLAVASDDRTVRIYDLDSGLEVQTLGGHTGGINAVAYSPDGTQLLVGSDDNTATLHSAGSGNIVRTFNAQADVASVAFSPDGDLVLIGTDIINDPGAPAATQPLVLLFNRSSGAQVRVITGHTARITSVAFAPDGNSFVTASVDKSARLWSTLSGAELMVFLGHTNSVAAVDYFSDGTNEWALTGSSDFTARLWNAATGEEIRVYDGHTDRVTAVSFNLDGSQVLTGSADGSARVWQTMSGVQEERLSACRSTVSSVAFSPDGTQVAAGVAAQNSIQLDAIDRPSGNDLDLQVPVPLDVSDVPAGARYFLWAEIDTDRTTPVRTYSHVTVNVVPGFTQIIEEETPEVVYDANNSAAIVPPIGEGRQIINLGALEAGDRLHLSLLTTPGYGRVFSSDFDYSVLILDDSTDPDDPETLQPEMLAWYQSDFVLFTQDTRVVVSRDATYYLVLDGNPQSNSPTPGVYIRRESGFGDTPRRQVVFLDYRGKTALSVGDLPPFNVPVFDAGAETETIKTEILNTVRDLYVNADGDPFNIEFLTSDDDDDPGPAALHVYFGGDAGYGLADYIDPRNDTLTGNGIVFTDAILSDFSGSSAAEKGLAIGRVTGHEVGHLLGLRHVDNDDDVMAAGNPLAPVKEFMKSPIRGAEQYNAQIGYQDGPDLLEQILGLAP